MAEEALKAAEEQKTIAQGDYREQKKNLDAADKALEKAEKKLSDMDNEIADAEAAVNAAQNVVGTKTADHEKAMQDTEAKKKAYENAEKAYKSVISEAEKTLEEKIKAAEDAEAACKAAEKVYEDAEKKHTEAAAEYTMAVSYVEKYKTIDISDRKAHKIVVTGVKNKVYTGKATTQSVRVTVDGKNATVSISYPGGRTSVGRHTVTIKGTGKYTGTLSFKYDILPKAVSSKKVKAASKSLKVSYKKVSGVTGYQIAYRQKGKSSWTYKTTKSTSKTISKLKAKKKYQLRVRTYEKVSGKNYYSSWSSISSVKTK